jgi:copper(I)-binding protein
MRLLMLLSALLLAQPVLAQSAIQVSDAYAHPPIGAGKVAVAFMTLSNTADTDYRLLGATSDAFGRIELHTHLNEDGIMKMRKVDDIALPAGEKVSLKPGGLFDATSEMAVGDTLEVVFSVQGAPDAAPEMLRIEVPVKNRRAVKKPAHHEHHGHH